MRTYKKKMCLLLLGTLFAASAYASEPVAQKSRPIDPEVKDVILAVVDAYGGEEALRSIRGYHTKGKQWAVQSHVMIDVERWFGRPDRLRLELEYPDHHESRFTDGSIGWAGSSSNSLRPANSLKLQAMLLQTARLDSPLRLLEHEHDIERLEADGEGRIVLRLPIGSKLYIDYHIELKSHRIARMSMWMPGPPEMQFAADYGQFHEIEGVLIPFSEVTFAGATVTSQFQVTEFEWNPKDLDSALRPGMGAWD
jgi:hypothetical protein